MAAKSAARYQRSSSVLAGSSSRSSKSILSPCSIESSSTSNERKLVSSLGGASPSPSAPTDPREAFVAYAACMREHGIDMPDPQFEEDGRVTQQIGGPDGPEWTEEEFEAANEACGGEEGGIAIGSGSVPDEEA